jgi:tetratricopeptide (TPR) repeat protein
MLGRLIAAAAAIWLAAGAPAAAQTAAEVFWRGHAALHAGDYDGAIARYDRALDLATDARRRAIIARHRAAAMAAAGPAARDRQVEARRARPARVTLADILASGLTYRK